MPNHGTRPAVLVAALAAAAGLAAAALTVPAAASADPRLVPQTGNVIVEWNRTLLSLTQTPGAQPATIHPTRDFAIMSSAVYAAVLAVDPERSRAVARPIEAGAPQAAAAQAAHDVLSATFPAFRSALDAQLADDLAAIPSAHARAEGSPAGAGAAAAELQARANDGSSDGPPPYQSTGAPGDFRPTPPAFAAPAFTGWGAVTPFVLRRGDQFRPAPPAALDSPQYANAINEVQRLGEDDSSTRSTDQSVAAKFWSAPIQNYWNVIADDAVLASGSDITSAARTLALVDLALADATIGLYDAKYAYRLWRPITAIRLAGTDHNRATVADPDWTPLVTTPADPSYPGAHSTLSAAAATVLTALYGDRVAFAITSPTLPGVVRPFDSFGAAADEAGLSRIYAGIHTRLDHVAGVQLGDEIGRYALAHALP